MPLKFHAPGTRKGNRWIIARGTVGGERIEISTGTTDPLAAERFAARYVAGFLDGRAPQPGETVTFARAAERYRAARKPSKADGVRLDRLTAAIGTRAVGEITRDTLVEAADALYPGGKASSLNRNVIAPAAAVLHYAADNHWCGYRRIKRYKEPRPVTRALAEDAAESLIAAAAGEVRKLLLFLFRQGTRITDTLRLDWRHIDLKTRAFQIHVSKTDEWLTLPLSDEVFFALANTREKSGPVFPWRNRWAAYKAIRKAVGATGIRFTPHMARHSLGTRLSAQGASLKVIMGALGHRDAKSSLRYQAGEVEVIRGALNRGAGGGKKRQRAAKK
jgi:integrase